jgi:hypothetical protein
MANPMVRCFPEDYRQQKHEMVPSNIDGGVHDPEHSSCKPQNGELGIINNAAEAKIAPAKSKVFFVLILSKSCLKNNQL